MKIVFLLHSKNGIHLIASNIRVIYEALRENEDKILIAHLRSYSWYCAYLSYSNDIAVPLKEGDFLVISKRPVLSKWIPQSDTHCALHYDKIK